MKDKKNLIKIIIASVLFVIFIIDLVLVVTGKTTYIDNKVYRFIIGFKNDILTNILKCITFLASVKFIVVLVGITCLLIFIKKWYKLTPIVISAITHVITNQSVKYLVRRPRPDQANWLVPEDGFSFPSGHSMISVLFYGTLIYLMNKYDFKYKKICTPICLFIMISAPLSRVYLGVHYFTDIFGGVIYATGILLCLTILYDKKGK